MFMHVIAHGSCTDTVREFALDVPGKYLITKTAKTPVSSLVISCLDYCNSVFAGISQVNAGKLQMAMNYAARLVSRASR